MFSTITVVYYFLSYLLQYLIQPVRDGFRDFGGKGSIMTWDQRLPVTAATDRLQLLVASVELKYTGYAEKIEEVVQQEYV